MKAIDIYLPDSVADSWKESTGMDLCRLVEDAFALYVWAVQEVWQGRVVVSSDQAMMSPRVLTMPCLVNVASRRRAILASMNAGEK